LNYVGNTVESFLAVAESGDTVGDVYNSGSGSEISIRDLASLIQDVVGIKVDIHQDEERVRPVKSEVERLVCSAQKLTDVCGWQPRISLREGIQLTVHWMRDNLSEFKSDIYNI
jgi:dTDP-glucose 4,6-dehydratase